MIPLANAVAGVLIGILSDRWVMRLLTPVIWGIALYGFRWVLSRRERRPSLPSVQLTGRKLQFKVTPWFEFYYVQFLTAVATSMAFSVVAGFVKDLWINR